MKVAVSAKGKTLRSRVADRFGRCKFFVVVDRDTMCFEPVANPGLHETDAAGIEACRMLIRKGVDAVVVKNIGHNALVTLRGAGVEVYVGAQGAIIDAIERLKRQELAVAGGPTVGFQDGLGRVE